MEILVGVIFALFVMGKLNINGILSPLTNSNPSEYGPGTSPVYSTPDNIAAITSNLGAGYKQESTLATSGVSAGVQAATAAATAANVGSGVLKAIPIVGAVISAVIGSLLAASQKRAQEAVSENQALDNFLPNWDAAVKQVVSLFNSGQITLAQAGQLLGTPRTQTYFSIPVGIMWQAMWREIGPQIQPGRNGCSSGSVTQQEGVSFCGGKTYGAACCVAYDDIDNSMGNPHLSQGDCLFAAMKKAVARPGVPFNAVILGIYPSKYSTYSRPLYSVTVQRPHA